MKVETIKTIILVLLIMFSLLLTVALWTYQPNYDSLENEDGVIDETSINGEEVEISSLIAPNKFIFHRNGLHYAFSDPENVTVTFNELQEWTMRDLIQIEDAGIPEHDGSMVEVTFPTEIPSQAMPGLFTLEDESQGVPPGEFNRMFFVFRENGGAEVFFTSDRPDASSFRATISEDDASRLKAASNEESQLTDQVAFKKEDQRPIYLPKGPVSVEKDLVQPKRIEILPLQNELFPNPAAVKNTSTSSTEQRLTDYYRRLEVFAQGKRMEYVDLVPNDTEVQSTLSSYDVLEESVNFINGHEGWTDTFRLNQFSPSPANSTVQFNMYFDNYPLLESSDDIHKIELEFEEQTVQRYMRPLLDFEAYYQSPNQTEQLTSGENVISFLENSNQYSLRLIEDIQVGYRIEPQVQGYQVYELVPAWFVLENGRWKEITELTEGGDPNAMGTN
ncbi:YycH family regulatory protein [Halobacillus sp. Marseille-Q1614]|uniref:YycH family regulatory protein n=1 Tax=Halobacillus sp. Marseille-Q1614 TaxID=2709134 RepID=UPI00156FF14F|nr:two-component system activity regulator YycH [Halobacillus sp. Marseille-Q1614]